MTRHALTSACEVTLADTHSVIKHNRESAEGPQTALGLIVGAAVAAAATFWGRTALFGVELLTAGPYLLAAPGTSLAQLGACDI